MGICESSKEKRKRNKKHHNKGKQPYAAPVKDYSNIYATNLGNTFNTISQIDLMNNNDFKKSKPFNLYRYKGTYYKKGEQLSLMTVSLNEIQGNSLNKTTKYSESKVIKNNSLYNTCIDETENESSDEVIEIIYDGKMDENMIQKSTDKATINNYNEFIGKNNSISKKYNVDIYNKKSVKKNNNSKAKKNEENENKNDGISTISDIPRNHIVFTKYDSKN